MVLSQKKWLGALYSTVFINNEGRGIQQSVICVQSRVLCRERPKF